MNLPNEFICQMQDLLEEEYPAFVVSLDREAPVGVRINAKRADDAKFPSLFAGEDPVPWCGTGRYLQERPRFTFDPLFHAGCYYVQEASSMFLEQAVRSLVRGPVFALDLCAAPGGKSTHLASLLADGSLLVSNEVIRSRANVLVENTVKWGDPSVVVTNNDPAEIGTLARCFDLILADVPCSGEGMFRKDPQAVTEWSPGNVNLCAERQRRIVAGVWPALKPGGVLLYSTCTYNIAENEENIAWIADQLGGDILEIPVNGSWNVCRSFKDAVSACRFLPHRTRGEGFFMAAVRKGETGHPDPARRKAKIDRNTSFVTENRMKSWLKDPDAFYFFEDKGVVSAFPVENLEQFRLVKDFLRVVSAGVTVGEVKGKDMVPCHQLALSTALDRQQFPGMEVDREQAIRYLRKEVLFDLPADCPKGYHLVLFEGHPLGFLKNIGCRANNLYPQQWRIRANP